MFLHRTVSWGMTRVTNRNVVTLYQFPKEEKDFGESTD